MFISNVGEFGVGEMVGYYSHSDGYRSMMGVGYGKVTKINGHGHIILDNGKTFDKHGDERGPKYYKLHLINAEKLRNRVAENLAQGKKATMVRDLIRKLEGSFSYAGTVHIDSDTKQELLAMVNSL
jgi:hypothetical protein